jgi:nucleoside-diphosphate-sugar epimerase/2-polyprenyl-3-methyl-5-hydroxy-6-metoxy-1,4-benzoquinol methylase
MYLLQAEPDSSDPRLAIACMERGYDCTVYGQVNNDAEAMNLRMLEKNGVRVVLGSITDRKKVSDAVKGIDTVYHLAAAQHEANVPDSVFRDVNVEGTRSLLDACVTQGIKRFVHGSTIGVFGSVQGEIDENTTCTPDNIYGETKLEGERLVLSYKDRLPVVAIRISETYGPGDRRLLKLFKAVTSRFFFMIGRGKNLHQLIYIDDLVDGFLMAAENQNALGEVFLLVGKEPITTNQMVHMIAASVNAAPPKIRLPFFPFWLAAVILETVLKPLGIQPPLHRRRMDFFKKSFSFKQKKASEILGFIPQVNFQEGARRTAEWYKDMKLMSGSPSPAAEVPPPSDDSMPAGQSRAIKLTARTEAFDSFWEAPTNIEKGYDSFGKFYRRNYLRYMTADRSARILAISCGYGYLVQLLNDMGYSNVLGIDSDPDKIKYARERGLNCRTQYAFEFLTDNPEPFDLIFAEQEINHLTKDEMERFLLLCRENMTASGSLVVHSLNGANPITGSEAMAQNFDHYNTLTEYSLKQILEHTGFSNTVVFPLKLYIFYENPANYIGMAIDFILNIIFRLSFLFYGKSNKLFSKKIGARTYK